MQHIIHSPSGGLCTNLFWLQVAQHQQRIFHAPIDQSIHRSNGKLTHTWVGAIVCTHRVGVAVSHERNLADAAAVTAMVCFCNQTLTFEKKTQTDPSATEARTRADNLVLDSAVCMHGCHTTKIVHAPHLQFATTLCCSSDPVECSACNGRPWHSVCKCPNGHFSLTRSWMAAAVLASSRCHCEAHGAN